MSHGDDHPANRLCKMLVHRYGRRMTAKQLRGPWTYIGTYAGEISGVIVPPDGDNAGFRVMLVDLELPDFGLQPELDSA